jgi:outer membrane protein OmpA-like peptidoglycan-associated protein
MKRFIFAGVLIIIAIWCGRSPAMDCRRGADYYYRAKSVANRQQSIEWLQRSTAACPNFNAWYMLGLLYRGQGQLDQAVNAFTQARAVAGSIQAEALALGRKGEILSQTGHLPQALRELELAKQFHPAPVPAWLEIVLRNARIQSFRNIMAAADIASFLDAGLYTSKNGRFTVRPTVNLPVHFDFNRADLNSTGNRQVFELGRALSREKMRQSSFLLVGHTDNRGTRTYNQVLSEKRAGTVKKELEQQFPSLIGQLKATGRGETQLLYDGDDETDHMLNRRVKVTLIP